MRGGNDEWVTARVAKIVNSFRGKRLDSSPALSSVGGGAGDE